jgi:hypothetical protein
MVKTFFIEIIRHLEEVDTFLKILPDPGVSLNPGLAVGSLLRCLAKTFYNCNLQMCPISWSVLPS